MSKINYHVYPPNCVANPSDKFLCEVRDGGWIADWRLFDDEVLANEWGKTHDGTMSKKAAGEIVAMVQRHENK